MGQFPVKIYGATGSALSAKQHIDVKFLPQMTDETSRCYLFVAIDRTTRWVFIGIYSNKTAANARLFGTDFNAIGQVLLPALSGLGDAVGSKRQIAMLIWASLTLPTHPQEAAAMQRMGYTADVRLFEPLQSRALRGVLRMGAKKQGLHSAGPISAK
jgi:hypothetical protein